MPLIYFSSLGLSSCIDELKVWRASVEEEGKLTSRKGAPECTTLPLYLNTLRYVIRSPSTKHILDYESTPCKQHTTIQSPSSFPALPTKGLVDHAVGVSVGCEHDNWGGDGEEGGHAVMKVGGFAARVAGEGRVGHGAFGEGCAADGCGGGGLG
eukprot:scaffold8508_cov51-Cyclotella_meneghiniana.AAC.6